MQSSDSHQFPQGSDKISDAYDHIIEAARDYLSLLAEETPQRKNLHAELEFKVFAEGSK